MLKNISFRLPYSLNAFIRTPLTYLSHVNTLKTPFLLQNGQSFELAKVRPLTVSSSLQRNNEKRENVKIGKDEGTQGEVSVSVDQLKSLVEVFPDENTPDLLFDGVRFADLHIVHIQIHKNNTKMGVTDSKGVMKMNRSCLMEGFKNARKGTSIAAQATGISLGARMFNSGIRHVRVKIAGLGPGRIAGLKGLTMSGVTVVSISDCTDINYTSNPRPKKRRRV